VSSHLRPQPLQVVGDRDLHAGIVELPLQYPEPRMVVTSWMETPLPQELLIVVRHTGGAGCLLQLARSALSAVGHSSPRPVGRRRAQASPEALL
jgi:hypothetical protein